jgi:H+/Cl- antiporter ClcA
MTQPFSYFLNIKDIVSSLSTKNSVFKPFLIAGIVLIIFGTICLWLAQVIQLKEEGEGFRIIGWRFIIGGIISIIIAYLSKYFSYYIWRKIKGSKYDDLYKP